MQWQWIKIGPKLLQQKHRRYRPHGSFNLLWHWLLWNYIWVSIMICQPYSKFFNYIIYKLHPYNIIQNSPPTPPCCSSSFSGLNSYFSIHCSIPTLVILRSQKSTRYPQDHVSYCGTQWYDFSIWSIGQSLGTPSKVINLYSNFKTKPKWNLWCFLVL